ncbi:MAG: aspartate/tyrosine/aromatic aminotransferase [Gammaproteobacteria bacterium]|nr:aromatic amino acid aminotransferase [Gammaproteobacteria bacterium]
MFETLEPLPPDAILGMMALYRADPDPRKIDLSVGVYQDEEGRTPILESVKRAERAVFENEDTKTYVAIAGNAAFNRGVEGLLFGDAHPAVADGRVVTLQTPGGSGALCVAAHLIRRARPEARVHISEPSWPNHIPLLTLSGLEIATYPYYDQRAHRVDFERMVDAVEKIPAGDLLLLHACCHNPCGADLTRDQWQTLAELCERRGIVPFIDLAYQGFAEGLDEDAYGVRLMSERMPEVVVVSSCSKNFGLYRERVGSVSIVAANAESAKGVASHAANVARGIYSMPPDHGAAIVARILGDAELRALWEREVAEIRTRLNALRRLLADKLAERSTPVDFSFIANERGMFSFLGLDRERVVALRERFHIYMIESSRINVAGIRPANVDYIADAIAAVLE